MGTEVSMHLRPPSTSTREESMFPEDNAYYEFFDEEGSKLSGYAKAGDVFYEYSNGRGNPLFGHVTLTRSERSPVAALVADLLDAG